MDLQQSAGSVQVDIGGWIGDGFKHLSNNWGKYVRPYLTVFGIVIGGFFLIGCMGGIGSFGVGIVAQNAGSAGSIISLLFGLFMGLLGLAFAAATAPLLLGFTKAVQMNLRGEEVPSNVITGEFKNFIPAALLILMIAVGSGIGYVLCVIPGLLFLFASSFAIPIMADRGGSPVDAIKGSISMVQAQPVPIILFLFASQILVGLLNIIPLAFLVAPIVLFTLQNLAYLRLSGSAGRMGDDGILRNAGF
jgi:hypothetical protein